MRKPYLHTFELIQADGNGIPVPGTCFELTVSVRRSKRSIRLDLPTFNFYTQAALSPNNPLTPPYSPLSPGGMIITNKNPLPKRFRPTVNRSFLCGNNDGFLQPLNALNIVEPSLVLTAFNAEIDKFGQLRILAAGQYNDVIPPGGHTLNARECRWCRVRPVKLQTKPVSKGLIDITAFVNSAAGNGIRDSHVNDVYKGTLAACWSSNQDAAMQSNGVMDVMVGMVKMDQDKDCQDQSKAQGKVHHWHTTNLTQFSIPSANQGYTFAWDTAIAIGKPNSKYWIASSGIESLDVNQNALGAVPAYFTSTDAGHSWSAIQYVDPVTFPLDNATVLGDCRGVLANYHNDFLYSVTLETVVDDAPATQMFIYLFSGSDACQGQQAPSAPQMVYATSSTLAGIFDFPQMCIGVNGMASGMAQQGVWFYADWVPLTDLEANIYPAFGFLPIANHQVVGGPILSSTFGDGYLSMSSLVNNCAIASITSDLDGRVYIQGAWAQDLSLNFYGTLELCQSIKQPSSSAMPDPLSPCLLMPVTTIQNCQNAVLASSESYPGGDYFDSVQVNVWDEARHALYVSWLDVETLDTQNYTIWLGLSLDRGTSYIKTIHIGSGKGNRGFQSMALDSAHEDDHKCVAMNPGMNPGGGGLLLTMYESDPQVPSKLRYVYRWITKEWLDQWVQ